MIILIAYIAIFAGAFFAVQFIVSRLTRASDLTSLKTVTFGDESAVTSDRWASVISVVTIFLIWGAFTGSVILPIHVPGPFVGETSFTYTAEAPDGSQDDAQVAVRVFEIGVDSKNWNRQKSSLDLDLLKMTVLKLVPGVQCWHELTRMMRSRKSDGAKIVAINDEAVNPGDTVKVDNGVVTITAKGTPNIKPAKGWQMEPIWLPAPEAVLGRIIEISQEGYQNSTLVEHLGWSLFRVIGRFHLWKSGWYSFRLCHGA